MPVEVGFRPEELDPIHRTAQIDAPVASMPIDRSKLGFSTRSTIAPAEPKYITDALGIYSRPTLPSPNAAKGALDVCMICEAMIRLITDHLDRDLRLKAPVLEQLKQKKFELVEQLAKANTEKDRWAVANSLIKLAMSVTCAYTGIQISQDHSVIGPLIAGAAGIGAIAQTIDTFKIVRDLSQTFQASKETEELIERSIRSLTRYTDLLTQIALISTIGMLPDPRNIQAVLKLGTHTAQIFVQFGTASSDHRIATFAANQLRAEGEQVVQRRKMEAGMKEMAASLRTAEEAIDVMQEAVETTRKGGK